MPHLNLDLDYFEHRKVRRLVGLLGRGSEVLPIRLWVYCGKYHCENGKLTGYTAQEIESAVQWWGKPGVMVRAMAAAGFLERDGKDWVVHGWLETQGHIPALKEKGRQMAKARWDKLKKVDADSMHTACSQQSPNLLNQPTNQPTNGGLSAEERWEARHRAKANGGPP